jgi:GDPmannose 4,6-dehydratase
MKKTALITGITGQDGSYLAELLIEKGMCKKTGEVLVEVDPKYFRPTEVETLLGNPSKAKTLLGWNPTKTSFEKLVEIMVKHDLDYVDKMKQARY